MTRKRVALAGSGPHEDAKARPRRLRRETGTILEAHLQWLSNSAPSIEMDLRSQGYYLKAMEYYSTLVYARRWASGECRSARFTKV